jgi:hypothetical protein
MKKPIKQADNTAYFEKSKINISLLSINERVSNALPRNRGKGAPISDAQGNHDGENQRLRVRHYSIQKNAKSNDMSSVHKDIGSETFQVYDVGEMQQFLNEELGTFEQKERTATALSPSRMWQHAVEGTLERALIHQRVLSCELIMKKITGTYIWLCITAFAGVILQVGESEHLYYNIPVGACQINGVATLGWYNPGATITFLKLCISLLSVLSVWLTYVHYTDKLELGIAQKTIMPETTLYSAGLMFPMVCEMAILSIHSPPFMDRCFELTMGHLDGSYAWTYDAVLSIGPLFRVYLVYGLCHCIWGHSKQRDTRMLATLNQTDITPW